MAYNNLGIMHYDRKEYSLAIEMFAEGLEQVGYLPLNKGRALACIEVERFDEAIVDIDICIDAMPKAAVFFYYRSRCHLGRGDMGSALEDVEHAIELDGTDSSFRMLKARIEEKMKN